MSLRESLEALLAEHDRIGSPLREQLLPGPPRDEVAQTIRATGLEPPDELVDFFSWRTIGDDAGGRNRIAWFWPATPFRPGEAVDEYRGNVELGGVGFAEVGDELGPGQPPSATFTGFWRTDWFPVFAGGPETYAVECPGPGSTPGAVWRVNWHPDDDFQTTRVAPSLGALVDAAIDLFRAGGYRWAPEHHTIVTVDEVFEDRGLGRHLRPGAPSPDLVEEPRVLYLGSTDVEPAHWGGPPRRAVVVGRPEVGQETPGWMVRLDVPISLGDGPPLDVVVLANRLRGHAIERLVVAGSEDDQRGWVAVYVLQWSDPSSADPGNRFTIASWGEAALNPERLPQTIDEPAFWAKTLERIERFIAEHGHSGVPGPYFDADGRLDVIVENIRWHHAGKAGISPGPFPGIDYAAVLDELPGWEW